eukprot:g14200.t1
MVSLNSSADLCRVKDAVPEEEEQRRLERGEVESESGLSDSEDEEVLDTASVDTETTCTPTSSQSAATTLKVPEKEATLASTGAVAKTLLHELKGLASAESLAVLARGSALSAVRPTGCPEQKNQDELNVTGCQDAWLRGAAQRLAEEASQLRTERLADAIGAFADLTVRLEASSGLIQRWAGRPASLPPKALLLRALVEKF